MHIAEEEKFNVNSGQLQHVWRTQAAWTNTNQNSESSEAQLNRSLNL